MNLIRVCFVLLAVLLPTSWTIARAADEPAGESSGGEMKKPSKKKKSKKAKDEGAGDADKK